MQGLVAQYLNRELSRRNFIKGMTALGFSIPAIESVVNSLTSFAHAEAAEGMNTDVKLVEGFGGDILVEQFIASGVEFLFCANGSGTRPIYDALVDRPQINVILSVEEGQAVSIASGYTMASGKIGVVNVAKIGTPHTTSNMYNAWKDRLPMLIVSDMTPLSRRGQEGFEDVDDILETTKQYTKWRWGVELANKIPEVTRRAIKVASTPPGGPVYVAQPDDILAQRGVKAKIVSQEKFIVPMKILPNSKQIEEAAKMLVEARSPVIVAGMEVWPSGARPSVVELAELLGIPVFETVSWSAPFPTDHPLYINTGYLPKMRYPSNVDLLLNLGGKMPNPENAKAIHIGVESAEIGRIYPVEMGIVADVGLVAKALIEAIKGMLSPAKIEEIARPRLTETKKYTDALRQAQLRVAQAQWNKNTISWERLSTEINEMVDKDAYIVHEFGSAAPKALNYLPFSEGGRTLIGRTTGSALGWGVGASIGVKLAKPNHQVISLQGDGGFMFGQIEALWTMSRYNVPVITIVYNNYSYNEPRNRHFSPMGRQGQTGKDMICYLGNPNTDFAKLASGFGIKGEKVITPNNIKPALERAIKETRDGRPYLIDVEVARTGLGAESTWYPSYSVAKMRTKKV